MQPRRLLTGTYGCSRRHQPDRTGGQHESVPQPRVVGNRAARSGPRHLGHGGRARGRDRTPSRAEAGHHHRVRPPAGARTGPGAITNGQRGTVTDGQPGTVTDGHAGTVTDARSHALSSTVADAHAETLSQSGADSGGLARPRARTKPFAQAGTLAGKGATNAVSPEEFTDFYAASFRRLVGQLYTMTGNHAEAQDAVQEAFIRAWAHRRRLDRSGSPEAWVRATAWRIAVSRWQRARLGRALMRSSAPTAPVDGPSPDRVALIEGLRQVPAEQRRALVLYHVCDQSVAQIAAETGVPVGTVKARLARGRAALAPHLRDTALPDGAASADRR
jgi:RNA polymerase sigma-70 factor, ECF subfamily